MDSNDFEYWFGLKEQLHARRHSFSSVQSSADPELKYVLLGLEVNNSKDVCSSLLVIPLYNLLIGKVFSLNHFT